MGQCVLNLLLLELPVVQDRFYIDIWHWDTMGIELHLYWHLALKYQWYRMASILIPATEIPAVKNGFYTDIWHWDTRGREWLTYWYLPFTWLHSEASNNQALHLQGLVVSPLMLKVHVKEWHKSTEKPCLLKLCPLLYFETIKYHLMHISHAKWTLIYYGSTTCSFYKLMCFKM